MTCPSLLEDLKSIDQFWSVKTITLSYCYLDDLCHLLENVPTIKYLNCQSVVTYYKLWMFLKDPGSYQCSHIKHLKMMKFECSFDELEMLIQHTPYLKSLTISTDDNEDMINADQWECLTTSLLPQLIHFKFKFNYSRRYDIIEKFQLFQSDFWQKQHHWYTEYEVRDKSVQIYTIPYISNTFILSPDLIIYSNKLANPIHTFDNVTNLIINENRITEICPYYFSNVTSLLLRCKTHTSMKNDKIHIEPLIMIINLSKLKHLDISNDVHKEMPLLLLEILKEIPNISSMNIAWYALELLFSNIDLHKYLRKMIRKLTICGDTKCIFGKPAQMEIFCQIFSNLDELKCDIAEDDSSFLLHRFPKLSIINK